MSKVKTVSVTTSQRVYAVFTDVDLDFIEEFLFEGLMEVDVDVDAARIELSGNEILVDMTGGTASVSAIGSTSNVAESKVTTSSSSQSTALPIKNENNKWNKLTKPADRQEEGDLFNTFGNYLENLLTPR